MRKLFFKNLYICICTMKQNSKKKRLQISSLDHKNTNTNKLWEKIGNTACI